MNGTVYELYSPNCELRYIGSTKKCLKIRLNAHKSKRHPIFQHSDVNIRALEENVPADKLKKKEGEYIRRAQGKLFNTRIAGRTQRGDIMKIWTQVVNISEACTRQSETGGAGITDS